MAKTNMRNRNLIFNIIIFAVTIGLVILSAYLGGSKGFASNYLMILYFILGAIVAGIIHVVIHELGHIIAGKRNKMTLLEVRFLCFDFKKTNGKTQFSFVWNIDTAGETVMIPNGRENILKRFSSVSMGGIIASGIVVILGAVGVALVSFLPPVAFAFVGMILPIGAYNFLSNALPMSIDGALNDGAVCQGANNGDSTVKVMASMLEVESELYSGKTYGEIDKSLYFDVPQLPEDDLMFVVLLTNRYYYYLDLNDTENALKVSDRLYSLLDNMPKPMRKEIKKNFLYDACALKLNENEADDLADELTRQLNTDNSAYSLRIKTAYLLYVVKDYEAVQKFIVAAEKACKTARLKGQGLFELKLINRLKDKIDEIAKTPMLINEGEINGGEISEGEIKE